MNFNIARMGKPLAPLNYRICLSSIEEIFCSMVPTPAQVPTATFCL